MTSHNEDLKTSSGQKGELWSDLPVFSDSFGTGAEREPYCFCCLFRHQGATYASEVSRTTIHKKIQVELKPQNTQDFDKV